MKKIKGPSQNLLLNGPLEYSSFIFYSVFYIIPFLVPD